MAPKVAKITASTQEHLDIEDITEDLVILKTGWVALVMLTTAVNFDILSEAEQDATIYAYAAFLNSLSFPVQILIRSKKADITTYFHHLTEAFENQPNPDLKRQIQKYMDFIQSTVQQKTVLDKRFYLVINFSPLELGIRGFKKQTPARSKSKAQLIKDAKIALIPKRDHLIKQTARLGLTTKQLLTKELIELFYDIYNPAPTGTQRVMLDSASYTVPLVEPAVEVPVPSPMPQSVAGGGMQNDSLVNLGEEVSQIPSVGQPPVSGGAQAQNLQGGVASNYVSSQQDALKNLQEATARASQLINQQPVAGNPADLNQQVQDQQKAGGQ